MFGEKWQKGAVRWFWYALAAAVVCGAIGAAVVDLLIK